MNHKLYPLLVAFGLLFSGCAATEPLTSFFVLTRPGDTGVHRSGGPRVFVRRIEVAPYLDKTSLVEMKSGNQVTYAPTAHWAEPLGQGFGRAVADNLRRSFGIQAYSFSPLGPPPAHETDVTIRLERFEGNENGDVILLAQWGISGPGEIDPSTRRTTEIHRSGWKSRDYPDLARLLSEEVVELSREIGKRIAP